MLLMAAAPHFAVVPASNKITGFIHHMITGVKRFSKYLDNSYLSRDEIFTQNRQNNPPTLRDGLI